MGRSTLFKQFWDEKKHIFQFCGALIAIGAIFLNISPSDNLPDVAKSALSNLQAAWLVVITVSLISIIYTFLLFILKWEKNMSKRHNFNFEETLSIIFLIICSYILVSLCAYIYVLYKDPLRNFFVVGTIGEMILLGTILAYANEKLVKKWGNKISPFVATLIIITSSSFLVGFVFEISLGLIVSSHIPSIQSWLRYSIQLLIVMTLFKFGYNMLQRIKKQLQKIVEEFKHKPPTVQP